jgi:hypothetical protein
MSVAVVAMSSLLSNSRDSAEGENDLTDVVISGNTITDTINASKFGFGVIRTAIFASTSSTSWVAPVQPTTPTLTEPDTLSYLSNTDVAQNAGGQRILIANNVISITLPPLAAYSDWGYGEAFTATGFTDPDMSTGFTRGSYGVTLGGPMLGPVVVSGNIFDNVLGGVFTESSASTQIKNLLISGNVFHRFASDSGITLDSGSAKYGRVKVVGNFFDGDPYFESSNRLGTPNDGTWSSGSPYPAAIWSANFDGLDFSGNTFRNVNVVLHTDSDTRWSASGNTYVFQPAAAYTLTSGSNSNKGIRSLAGIQAEGSMILWEVSDPTDSSYGTVLSSQGSLTAGSIPTSGYYATGQFVRNTQITESGVASSKYTIHGWLRLTTGNAHVLNTDWRELRCLTGN